MSLKDWETVKIAYKVRPGEDHGLLDGCNDSMEENIRSNLLKVDQNQTRTSGLKFTWSESTSLHSQSMRIQTSSSCISRQLENRDYRLRTGNISARMNETNLLSSNLAHVIATSEQNIPLSVAFSPNRPTTRSLSYNALNAEEISKVETKQDHQRKNQHLQPMLLGELLNEPVNRSRTSQELPIIIRPKIRNVFKVTILSIYLLNLKSPYIYIL